MKKILILFTFVTASIVAPAQGVLYFSNDPTTLILADGAPMPVVGTRMFVFALFLAPSTTVDAPGITPALAVCWAVLLTLPTMPPPGNRNPTFPVGRRLVCGTITQEVPNGPNSRGVDRPTGQRTRA